MARRVMEIALALTIVTTMLSTYVSAQSGCTTAIISLAPCLNYISGNTSTPSSSCCSALASIVKSQPRCLCTVLNGGASSLGVAINQTKALELPGACKVQTPPVSQCNAVAGAPAATPTASPTTPSTTPATPSTTSTPSVPSVPSGSSGSKSTPSTTSESSDAKSNKSAMMSILFLASCASLALVI
ncbi:non-specific lipid transfer protein GPI-anchored 15-like [Typha angustifolia]|uniref:non-specific lipid transfer protein GPI-anchored 15-like n=1 Tax=Typha angustifolia TaxID=59011 RepID=UPI003C2FC123